MCLKYLFVVKLKLNWERDGKQVTACITRPFCLNHLCRYGEFISSSPRNVWHMQVDSKFIVFNELQGNLICEDISICKFIHHSLRCVDIEYLHYTILQSFCVTSAYSNIMLCQDSLHNTVYKRTSKETEAHIYDDVITAWKPSSEYTAKLLFA